MGTCSRLATTLDTEMLAGRVPIAPSNTADSALRPVSGQALFDELGGRWLIRYVRSASLSDYNPRSRPAHFSGTIYVTPTALEPDELTPWLALPSFLPPPTHAVLLNPQQLDALGPRWVRLGGGIEYILPGGFPASALVAPGWPVPVQ